MRALVVALLAPSVAGIWAANAWAADAPMTPDAVATQVKAAHDAADAARLKEWAEKDAPDPWIVADALLASGARDAAAAFAKAAPRKDVERLPELVAGWKPTEGDATARRALQAGNAALMAKQYADALAAFESAKEAATPVIAVRLVHGRAIALQRLERPADAAARYDEAATAAERMGWYARAAGAVLDLMRAEFGASRAEPAVAAARRLVLLETSRGNRSGVATAHRFVGGLEAGREQFDAAIVAYRLAIAVYDESADGAGSARARNDVAEALLRKGDHEGAMREASEALRKVEPMGLMPEVSRSHATQGQVRRAQRLLTPAISSFQSALAAAEATGDPGLIAGALFELGRCLSERDEGGDLEKALALHLRVQRIYEELDNRPAAASSLANAAKIHFLLGRVDVAKEMGDRVVKAGRELRNPWIEGRGLYFQGELADHHQKPADAVAAYTAAAARFEAAGSRVENIRAFVAAADATRRLGDLAKAREHADRALKDTEALKDRGLSAYVLLVAARIRKEQGLREEALALARRSLEDFRFRRYARGVAELEALVKELEVATPK